jgi:hypothetical protein
VKYLLLVIVLSCLRFSAVFLSPGKFCNSVLRVIALDLTGIPNCNVSPTDVAAYTSILIYKCFAFYFICIYTK